MRGLDEIDAYLALAKREASRANEAVRTLECERDRARGWMFAALNGITADKVAMSTGEGVPWFGMAGHFVEFLRKKGIRKPWLEWNGRVYRTSELQEGRMDFEQSCPIECVRGAK